MESPGAADTKTSRTSVPSTASCDREQQAGHPDLKAAEGALQRWVLCPSLLPAGTFQTLAVYSPPPWQQEGSGSTPTFVFLFSCSNFLYLFGWFHEEREDGSQPKDVHKLVAVVCALWSNHGMVQHLQGTAAGNLLLSVKRGKLNCTGSSGVPCFKETRERNTTRTRWRVWAHALSQIFLLETKTLYQQYLFSKPWLRILSWLFLF